MKKPLQFPKFVLHKLLAKPLLLICKISVFPVLISLIVLSSGSAFSQITKLPNGDKIAFDGSYYDFRDAQDVQMIKLWVPPGVDVVRGVFISGHGGGGGDSRNFARDENMRAFATRLGFAVAGLHNFPGRRAYEQGAESFFGALDAFAGMGHHPELANIPFVMYGSSNGGAATWRRNGLFPGSKSVMAFLASLQQGQGLHLPPALTTAMKASIWSRAEHQAGEALRLPIPSAG